MSQTDKRLDRRRFIKYGGLLGAGTVVAGCTGGRDGDSDGGDGTTTTAGDDTTTTEETTADEDGGGGGGETNVDTYATIVAPSSIDPMKSTDELEGILNHTVYDPLLYYSYEYPPKVRPWIAEDWTASDDGLTYTFQIRDDVTFHNGDSLTAEDVAFSVERMMTMGAGPSWMWSGVLTPDSATVEDETTVTLELEQTYAPFLATLPWMFVVNEQQVLDNEADGDFGDHGDFATGWLEDNDAGSGAYSLDTRQRGTNIRLTRHDDWWGPWADGNVYEEVDLALAQEVSTIVGKMKNAEADMTDGWLSIDTYNQLGQSDNVTVSEEVTFIKPFYVYMNVQSPPLDDVHVRKALSYAFDYQTAVNDVLVGARKLRGPLPSDFEYSTTDGVEEYTYDMEQAKAHLDQSSYAPEEVDVTYTYVSGLTTEKNLGLLMQSSYNELGINFSVQKSPWTKIVSNSTNVDTAPQMFPLWNNTVYADPDAILYGMWHSDNLDSYLNGSKYASDEMDSLLEEGRHTPDEARRAEVYKQIQQTVADEAAAIFCCLDVARWANASDLQGFVNNGINGYTHQFHNYHKA